jgi:hypothetical protein
VHAFDHEETIMGLSYDDEYGFSSQDIIAAAITAEELAEVLRSPDTDDCDLPGLHAGELFRAACEATV